uniref:Uncharacterized protein n=1 Tax=Panagrolaimus sp. ES5 TaxID=591445 RepID=A0AC34F1F7_9BILA
MDLDNLRHALPTNLSTSTSVSNMVYTFKNPYPQHFSILYHIVEYMIENPQSGKAWKKLIMSCKYFYSKKPVFSVSTLDVLCDVKCRADNENFDATSPFPKLWVFDKLETKDGEFVALKPLMPKIAKFDLRVLQIDDETLTWKDYQKLTSSDTIEQLFFKSIIIKNANGTMVTFDKILQNLPHLKAIEMLVYLKLF